jgi:hypothetical protein
LDPGSRICAFILETGFIALRRFFIYGFFQGLSHRRDSGSFEDRTSQPPFELSGPLVQQHVQTGHNGAPGISGGFGKRGPSGAVNYVHYGHFGFEKRVERDGGGFAVLQPYRSALDDYVKVSYNFWQSFQRNEIAFDLPGQNPAPLDAPV